MKHVMVLDDSPDTQRLTEAVLTRAGLRVSCASSSDEGLRLLQKEGFDLLVVDVVMPGTDGYGFLWEMKKRGLAPVPVVMLTGKKEKDDVLRAMRLGAVDYICKPFDRELFLSKIRSILGADSVLETVSFARCRIEAPISLRFGGQLVGLSETGMIVETSTHFDPGVILRTKCIFLDELGVSPAGLRVVHCDPSEKSELPFRLALQFVGLNEAELVKLRQYILQANVKNRRI